MSGAKRLAKLLFGKYLVFTNTAVSGLLMGAGDATAQMMEKGRVCTVGELDKTRIGRYFTYGLILGPLNHGWYNILDKMLPLRTKTMVIKKIALDQAIAGPLNIMAFFIGLSSLEGKPVEKSVGEASSNFWNVYKLDLAVWPAAQLINFLWVPRQIRMLYVCAVSFGWSTFLAHYRHSHVSSKGHTVTTTNMHSLSKTNRNLLNLKKNCNKKQHNPNQWIIRQRSRLNKRRGIQENEALIFERRKKVLERIKTT